MDSASIDEQRRSLIDSLVNPPVTASIDALRRMWEYEAIRFVCRRPPEMQDYPELPVRLRGAFGRALYAMPPRFDRRGQPLLPAREVLFDSIVPAASGVDVGKPFVIRALVDHQHIIVELRLFGMAAKWLDEAVVAMVAALEGGIALRPEQSLWVPLVVEDVLTASGRLTGPPVRATLANLTFRSPVSVRRADRRVTDPRSLLASVVQRVEAMAPWQSIKLAHDAASARATVDGLRFDDSDLTAYRWQRNSIRAGNQPIGVMGLLGRLAVAGKLAPLIDYLRIAETCNTGSHAGLGLGWFDLALYP